MILYQEDKPMIPFLGKDLETENLIGLFLKPVAWDNLSANDLLKIKLTV